MLTEEVTAQIIHVAKQYAKENFNSKFFAAHVLKALLNQQFDFIKELDAKGIDVFYLDEWADIRISEYPKATKPSESPETDNSATLILEEAETIATKKGLAVFPSILTAAITPGVGFSHDQLKSLPLNPSTIIELYQTGTSLPSPEFNFSNDATSAKSSSNAVGKYCIDRLQEIAKNKNDSVIIGRDEELKTITEVLNRKLKPHVIITGEPGVGKSALIEGFCKKIASKTILNAFDKATVFEINIGALFAGAAHLF